jgi:hypothetical protein
MNAYSGGPQRESRRSLVDQRTGLEQTDDAIWSIYFNTVLLARLDEREYIIPG